MAARLPLRGGSIEVTVMDDPRMAALKMLQRNETTVDELWLWYWANGGTAEPLVFDAYLYGLQEPDDYDDIILGWVIEVLTAR